MSEIQVLPLHVPVTPSVDVLHVPDDVSVPKRIHDLIRETLLTEFPVNRSSESALQLSKDEAADLLLSSGSPWARDSWWSADILPVLKDAISNGRTVTHRHLLSRLTTCSMPQQNIGSLRSSDTLPVETPRAVKPAAHRYQLQNFSLACNHLTTVLGTDLPRSLTSLQLYGNPLNDLSELFIQPPALQFLGLGKIDMTDAQLRILTALLQVNLPSLIVLDISDNHICDLNAFTDLVTAVPNLRAVTMSGNPAFLATGYYGTVLKETGRLKVLDGEEMTDEVCAALDEQLHPSPEKSVSATKGKVKKTSGKQKKPPKKSTRRPAPDLEAIRFEPSLTCALVRLTGLVHLPFVPKEKFPGLELVVIFEWSGERDCSKTFSKLLTPSPKPSKKKGKQNGKTPTPEPVKVTEEEPDTTYGLCPLEAQLQERNDVSVLETPLEWYCTDLKTLRDAMLQNMRVELVHREKWTPKRPKKGSKKKSDDKNDQKEDVKENKNKKEDGKARKTTNEKGKKEGKGKSKEKSNKAKGSKETKDKETVEKSTKDEPTEDEEEDVPPPEFSLGSLQLPLRGLLRPCGILLLHGEASSSNDSIATPTESHWSDAIIRIQEDKKQKKADAKKAAKEESKQPKKKSVSARSGSSRKKSPAPPEPAIECYFAVELYKKPALGLKSSLEVSDLPIDSLGEQRHDEVHSDIEL